MLPSYAMNTPLQTILTASRAMCSFKTKHAGHFLIVYLNKIDSKFNLNPRFIKLCVYFNQSLSLFCVCAFYVVFPILSYYL